MKIEPADEQHVDLFHVPKSFDAQLLSPNRQLKPLSQKLCPNYVEALGVHLSKNSYHHHQHICVHRLPTAFVLPCSMANQLVMGQLRGNAKYELLTTKMRLALCQILENGCNNIQDSHRAFSSVHNSSKATKVKNKIHQRTPTNIFN